jgi:hypothetical protein
MNKKMICINAHNAHYLTQNKIYDIIDDCYEEYEDIYYKCMNDQGELEWFFKKRFKECELQLSNNIKIL